MLGAEAVTTPRMAGLPLVESAAGSPRALHNADPDKISVHRWTLRFVSSEGADTSLLERGFRKRNAARFLLPLRVTTVIFLLANLMLIVYDARRFELSSPQFLAAILIRLAGMLPLCVGAFAFTYSKWYFRYPDLLCIAFLLLGALLIAYSIIGQSPGYGTLALLIVYMYSFSPASVWPSTGVVASLVIAFGVSLASTSETWLATARKDISTQSAGKQDASNITFNILGVLVVFFVIVFFIGHTLEQSLKRAFLDEYR